ncbi:hypothetical protein [Anaeromyxobacter oryzae]|uniref:Lipoprotein n=1 Tax=Anaeromyxobacter oryzae TaxID=2918170 RepID=A0ABM7WQ45_9BACT|nr:hypothetical protein [Anaeromyxobacter oryzae]BDG01587.1 hypothetical protein AMOR_05830 [Anaeromyxobacter oryzae]
MQVVQGMARVLAGLAVCAVLVAGSARGSDEAKPVNTEVSLRAFLRGWAAEAGDAEDPSTQYTHAWVNLRDNGSQQVVVYIEGPRWCGSGGCVLLVLEPHAESFRIVGYSTITWPPIRILRRVTNGWHDIGVRVAGGGIHPAHDAGLPFNGKKYPLNPSEPPARNATGESVISTAITGEEPGQPLWK